MLDRGLDQAAGLRRLLAPPLPGLLAVPLQPSAPLQWVAQLAHALRRAGRRPLVVDGARGALAGAFGLRPRRELLDLLERRERFDAVAQSTSDGIPVLRADHGLEAFAASGEPGARLLAALAAAAPEVDEVLVAMPARELASLADPAVTTPVLGLGPRPAAVVDSYAVLKELAGRFGYRRFACVVTATGEEMQARAAHARLAGAAGRFLHVDVPLAGWLPAVARVGDRAAERTVEALLRLTAPPVPAMAA